MEKHPQADPSQKSPVSKVLPPAPPEDTSKEKSDGVTNGSSLDKKLESSPTLASKTYQETKSEASAEAKTLESAGVASKNGQISGSQTDADKSLPHPIISVDIQKSMPYDNKQVVPEESTKPEPDVKPEVVASVVTTAVVKEAALAVSETESSVLSGSKVASDSSKVDAIVEQELAKISDSGSGKTELKTTVVSDGESKPLLNGDIDHSPVSETITGDSSKDDKCPKNGGVKTSTNQEIGKDIEVTNSDVSSCNGVPGIITVETITKKDNSSTLENNLQTEFTTSDAKETAEKDLKISSESNGASKTTDSKEEEKSDKAEKDIDDQESSTEKSGISVSDENLTDSAKLLKETGESGGKTQSEVKSNVSTEKSNLPKEDETSDGSKLEEKSTAKSEPCEPVADKVAKDMTVVSEENLKLCDKTENVDISKPESDPAKSPSKESSSKSVKSAETEKSDAKDLEKVASESATGSSETLSKGISDEKPYSKSSDPVVDDKSKSGSSPARKESPDLQPSKTAEDKTSDLKTDMTSKTEETVDVEYDMTAMMTSQILTPEMLNGDENSEQAKDVSTSDSKYEKDSAKTEVGDSAKDEDDSRISASRRSPETCDVGVGLDERKMARVAASDGGEEEVDGQQATTEVEVTEESLASHPDEADSENLVPSGAHSPTSVSPSSDRSQSSAKASPTPPSKPSSAISCSKNEESSKPASAVSRSSIPEPIVYEPPERRKSAASTSSDEKKELGKSQKDEKESEKSAETEKVEDKEAQEPSEVRTEKVDELKEDTATDDVQVCPEQESSTEDKAKTSEDDTKGTEKLSEKEKGEEDEKEKEDTSDKSGEKVETEETVTEKSEDADKSDAAEDEKNEENDERTSTPAKDAQAQEPEKDKKEEAETTQETDTDAKKETEIDAKPETESEETAAEAKDSKDSDESKAEDVSEVKSHEVKEEKEEDVKDNEDERSKLDDEAQKLTDEPTTLVEEDSKAESSEKEATGPEEKKEEDEAEEQKEDKGGEGAEEGEIERGEDETQKEAENEAIEGTETVKIEEREEQKQNEETEEKADDTEVAAEEEPKEEEQEDEKDAEKEETEKENTVEGKEAEPSDEPEKQDVEKGEEPDEKPESPPKSPTKRMRSPDKSGRRGSLPQLRLIPKGSGGWGTKSLLPVGRVSPFEGVSPISSPPKPLKTPPSPQKPQKSTSPKKKNGMLSPIKTPKTPGSDGRKLPPIKAPVGLAPNPNLKNIRSKIGSFDNIRYKPGGGDKKVISSKKLEWKAAPKIGSLDHSLKGEKKRFSKGESKEGKLVDGQSPLPSGDEGEQEGGAAATESVIKTESGPSTELPAAIAAES